MSQFTFMQLAGPKGKMTSLVAVSIPREPLNSTTVFSMTAVAALKLSRTVPLNMLTVPYS